MELDRKKIIRFKPKISSYISFGLTLLFTIFPFILPFLITDLSFDVKFNLSLFGYQISSLLTVGLIFSLIGIIKGVSKFFRGIAIEIFDVLFAIILATFLFRPFATIQLSIVYPSISIFLWINIEWIIILYLITIIFWSSINCAIYLEEDHYNENNEEVQWFEQ